LHFLDESGVTLAREIGGGNLPDAGLVLGIDERAREVGAKLGIELVTGVSPPTI
jgi:hypothetical protein